MDQTFDASVYVRAPIINIANGVTLANALVAACPEAAPENVAKARTKLKVVGNGLLWSAVGAAAGLAAAAPLSNLMAALLFEVEPIDPPTYAAVALGSLAAAAVASYLPARRLTRIHPVEALRAE